MQSTTIASRLSFDLDTPPTRPKKSAADQSLNCSSTLVVVSYRRTKQTARSSRAHGILIKLMLTARQTLAGLKIGLERCAWGTIKDRLVAGTDIGAGR
jgi:hypothetical protein